jgi:C_GCAxxG_C_C family probable redox protein
MKRREFIGNFLAGAAASASLVQVQSIHASEETAKINIDPDKFAETAYQHFIQGKRTCSESILMAGCETLALKSKLVPDIAFGLAGGVGLQGEICGVLTGCSLVLSLAMAKIEKDYAKKKIQTLHAVGRVHNAFKKQFSKTDCRSLCGLDLTTPEGRKKLEEGVKEQTCAKYVQAGSALLAKELQTLWQNKP